MKGGKLKLARIFSAGNYEQDNQNRSNFREFSAKNNLNSQARLRNPKSLKADNFNVWRPVTAKYSMNSGKASR